MRSWHITNPAMLHHAAKLVAIALLFTACAQQNDNGQLADLIKRLKHSNTLIRNFNNETLWDLEEVMQRPNPSADDLVCVTNGKKVNALSSNLVSYVESLHGIVTNDNARNLFGRLVQYKHGLLNLMEPGDFPGTPFYRENKKLVFKEFPVLDFIEDSAALSTAATSAEKWLDDNFSSADTLNMQRSLLKIKNEILCSEQILLKYLKSRTAELICGNYEQFSAIAVLNSAYIKSGDSIEVVAGVGSFTAASKPRIIIDGREIELNAASHAVYNFRSHSKPGKYIIPVEIEFFKPDGTRERIVKNLKYTIAQ